LADANKDHAQREQAVAERLHKMSTAAESKCFTLPSIFNFCCTIVLANIFLFFFPLLSAFCHAGFTGVSPSSLPPNDDPLMTAVNLLEENCISIQEAFELVNHVLSRLFVGLWPNKRAAVPKDNLSTLAKSFDTTEDPTL
jgi:hypothetical protein